MAAAGLKALMNNQRVASKVILIDDISMNAIYSGEESEGSVFLKELRKQLVTTAVLTLPEEI